MGHAERQVPYVRPDIDTGQAFYAAKSVNGAILKIKFKKKKCKSYVARQTPVLFIYCVHI